MPQEFKYLAIKNWEVYQPRNKKPFPWIRDYKEKEADPDFMSLTMLQRYVLDGCCRLRARFSKNLRNDPVWIARALCVLPVERRFIGQAISVLCLKGFLILTNDEDNLLEERRGEEKRGEEIRKNHARTESPKPPPEKQETFSTETSSVQAVIYLPLNSGKEFPITDSQFARWKHLYPAVDVLQQLRAMAGWLDSHPTRKKTNKGIKAFVNSWLQRAQDNPSGATKYSGGANGNGTSKADQRSADVRASTGRVFAAARSSLSDPAGRLQEQIVGPGAAIVDSSVDPGRGEILNSGDSGGSGRDGKKPASVSGTGH